MNIFLWLVLVVLVILALKKKARSTLDQAQTRQTPPEQAPGRPAAKAETMVCCAHCQVYLPASEAIYAGEQAYCSQAHADHA